MLPLPTREREAICSLVENSCTGRLQTEGLHCLHVSQPWWVFSPSNRDGQSRRWYFFLLMRLKETFWSRAPTVVLCRRHQSTPAGMDFVRQANGALNTKRQLCSETLLVLVKHDLKRSSGLCVLFITLNRRLLY